MLIRTRPSQCQLKPPFNMHTVHYGSADMLAVLRLQLQLQLSIMLDANTHQKPYNTRASEEIEQQHIHLQIQHHAEVKHADEGLQYETAILSCLLIRLPTDTSGLYISACKRPPSVYPTQQSHRGKRFLSATRTVSKRQNDVGAAHVLPLVAQIVQPLTL
jgi:hypothetical protein